ncbi:WG repeat-containing protein [Ekhidna sp.]
MRSLILFIFFTSALISYAEDFSVFEKDGYYGIKDETGNVTVPPVYEKLGWSDGSTEIHNGVIGFRDRELWGLITVRNKSLTGQKFYSITPSAPNFFKASIKGKFSNKLFHGILDSKGNTLISFNYFTIEPIGSHWLVGDFNGKYLQFGIVSFDNQVLVPLQYKSVVESNGLFIGKKKSHKTDLYYSSGELMQLGLDSLSFDDGWIAFRDGYAGFLSIEGKVIHDFVNKNYEKKGIGMNPVSFPKWTIYQADTVLLTWECDSLSTSKSGLLVGYLNGAHHLVLKNNNLLQNHEFLLKDIAVDYLVVQNSRTRKWSVLEENGKSFISGYDSIVFVDNLFLGLQKNEWFLLDLKGGVKNRLPYQQLNYGLRNQLIGKRNNHWGIIDHLNDEIGVFKYDSIITSYDKYLILYLNRWGVLNANGLWSVRPEYEEIIDLGDILAGRRGRGYTIYKNDLKMHKTTARPIKKLGAFTLILGEEGNFGLLNAKGEIEIYPEFESIKLWSDHYELSNDGVSILLNSEGERILRYEEGYQNISGYGEGFFSITKENRMGFVDNKGRLRISNRYDQVGSFQEGRAPILLRGRWGFINKNEQIRVQPYYESVSSFEKGKSIVEVNGMYGLVDKEGNEVLELIWKSIRRLSTGNYLVQNIDSQFGLVDGSGVFILRPAYDQLEDHGSQILVSNNNAWGVLDSDGQQIFKINHREIKVKGNYLMVKD